MICKPISPFGVVDIKLAACEYKRFDIYLLNFNIYPSSVADGAVLVDLSEMRGVFVDVFRKTARVQVWNAFYFINLLLFL